MLQLLPGRLSMNAGMLSVKNIGVVCSSLSSVPQRCQYFFNSVLPDIRHFHKGPDSSEDWIVWQAHACLSSIKCERLRSIVLASTGRNLISQKQGHACAAHNFIALVPGHMGPYEASRKAAACNTQFDKLLRMSGDVAAEDAQHDGLDKRHVTCQDWACKPVLRCRRASRRMPLDI